MRVFVYSYGVPTTRYPLNGIFAFDHAKALTLKDDVEVSFLFVDLRSIRRKRKFGFVTDELDELNVIGFSLPLGRLPIRVLDFFDWILFKLVLMKATKSYGKPEVIHSHFLRQSFSVSREISRYPSVKFFATIHDSNLSVNISYRQINQLRYIDINSSNLFSVSPSLHDNLTKYQIKSTLLNNIIDTDLFKYSKNNLIQNQNLFVSAGYLTHRKGMDVLLYAWSVARIFPYFKLVIMGDGPELDNLIKISNELELQDSVQFYGAYTRSQFATILCGAVAFVLASRQESFGVVYAEALAAGVPVIGTFCGGPESLINNTNGKLVHVESSDELANAMIEFSLNINSFDRTRISSEINEKFGAKKIANDLIKYYKKAIQGKEL